MSELSDAYRFTLSRSGFTEREINTMKRKFYNLFCVTPLMSTEVEEYRKWANGEIAEQIRRDEREACAKVCEQMDHDGVMIAKDCAAAIRARGRK